jgi:hypothetical protein
MEENTQTRLEEKRNKCKEKIRNVGRCKQK